jgi:hypothetical protein
MVPFTGAARWRRLAAALSCAACTGQIDEGTPSGQPAGGAPVSTPGGGAFSVGGSAPSGATSGVGQSGGSIAAGGAVPAGGVNSSGGGGSAGMTPTTPAECVGSRMVSPGQSPIRRLNRFEYNNTVAHLLKDESGPAYAFPLEEQSAFDNDATVLRVSRLLAESYLETSEKLADTALAKADTLPCAATAAAGDSAAQQACAAQLVDSLGKRTYRRPLSADERTRLLATYSSAREFLDFKGAVSAMLQTMLMSPQFLYRIESGTPVDGSPGVQRVDPYGLASRLSYFLWGSMPDDELLRAAEEGKLVTDADVRREAERMYGTERGRAVIRHFTRYWLDLTNIDQQGKDAALFPDYTPEIGTLMRVQTETFSEHVYADGAGTLGELFTAPYTYMNQTLAKFMGVTGPTSDAFVRVELDPKKHAGVLTEPAFLSYNATVDKTHPILRGVFVLKKLLCKPPGAPPPGIPNGLDDVADPNASARERLAAHRTSPACSGCHDVIDPIGFTFENFDAVGRWLDADAVGRPIDTSGELKLSDVNGPVANALELMQKLAQSAQVQECVAANWFSYANGRAQVAGDVCSMADIKGALAASGGNLRELVLSQTQTDAFLYRIAPEAQVTP